MVQGAPNGAGSRGFKTHLTVLVQEGSRELKLGSRGFKRVQES